MSYKSFKQIMKEMAPPANEHLEKIYYHGTYKTKDIQSIIDNGIRPPDLSLQPETHLRPIVGKVYVTPSLEYAVIYTIGGSMLGRSFHELELKRNPFGYLVVIDGKELKDIQPDEDEIGRLIYEQDIDWLIELAEDELKYEDFEETYEDEDGEEYEEIKNLYDAVLDGEIAAWAVAGKLLLRVMTDDQKLELISLGTHIAHTGNLWYKEIWKFDRSLSIKLNKDGSNFFELAERIK